MAARLVLFLGLLAIWLIVLLPLKAVAIAGGGMERLGYRDVFGTVWNGRIYGMEINGEPVREVAVSLRPSALVTGRLAADWRIADDSLSGHGRIALGAGRLVLDDASLVVSLSRIGAAGWPALDPDEPVFLRLSRLEMDGGRCVEVAGSARTGALVTLASAYGFEGPVLEGAFACREGALTADFGGEADELGLNGAAVLHRTAYDWRIEARTGRPDLAEAFALAGLEREGETWQAGGRERYAQD
jgi:general secretion pathway protein N